MATNQDDNRPDVMNDQHGKTRWWRPYVVTGVVTVIATICSTLAVTATLRFTSLLQVELKYELAKALKPIDLSLNSLTTIQVQIQNRLDRIEGRLNSWINTRSAVAAASETVLSNLARSMQRLEDAVGRLSDGDEAMLKQIGAMQSLQSLLHKESSDDR